MNRVINYTGQLLPASSLLQIAKDSMVGLSKVAEAILGTSTQIYGFAVTPTSPASMQVNVAPGVIFSLQTTDASAYGDLGTDSHQIVKQGVLADAALLTATAPGTAGQSINYLVQVGFSESDTTSVVLPYYNSAAPTSPFTGPGNTGTSQATRRQDLAVVSLKAGAAATTGTQTTPAPDAGYVGAYVVTVAYGQTTITSGNISAYASAPTVAQTTQLWAQISALATAAGITPDITVSTQLKSALDTLYAPKTVQGAHKNLAITTTGLDANVTVTADELVLGDGAGVYKTVRGVSLTINSAGTVGQPLSLSTGVLAANTFYAVWVWNNGTTTTATIDPSGTAPTAPAGYIGGTRARFGWVKTDGSSLFPLPVRQSNGIAKLSADGTTNLAEFPLAVSTSVTVSARTSFSISSFVPTTAKRVFLKIRCSSTSGTSGAAIYQTSTGATVGGSSCQGGSDITSEQEAMSNGSTLWYTTAITSGSVYIYVLGWEDNL